jgi:hypothetical protein
MKKRNPLPAPDLNAMEDLAQWLTNIAFLCSKGTHSTIAATAGPNLSDHAANVRRAIARLKQKDDATAQPQDWGKDE